ncbi:DUF484 family protein [bacterium]|nr:DUF484 family protein [bacterium]
MTRLHKSAVDQLDDDHVDHQRRVSLGEASEPRDVALDAIAEHDVLEYLAAHPEFLVVNPQVLETADIMHDAGNAASLIERQVDVLRQRNEQLRQRLHNLALAARANELRVRHTNRLATDLMQADNAASTVHVLKRALQRDFAVDASYIGLYEADVEGAANIGRDDAVRGELRNLIRTGIIECGPISENRAALLFGDEPIQSAAVMPLDRCDPIGLLAVGSRDPKRYQPEMGSMFLDLIAGLASTGLRRCLAQDGVTAQPADETAAVADAQSA